MANHKRKSLCPSLSDVLKFISGTMFLLPYASLIKAVKADSQEFPTTGTYKQQSDYIENLPEDCNSGDSALLHNILNADDPSHAIETYAQNGEHVKVWQHAFDPEFGIVTRRTLGVNEKFPSGPLDNREEVMLGGVSQDGQLKPLTFHFVRDKSGLLKPLSRQEISVTAFAEGVEKAAQEGVTARANTCYTARLKDKIAP